MDNAVVVPVLLVDDRAENLCALAASLEPLEGLELVQAESGDVALRQMLKRDFGLVLMDVQMPGMDGFEAATLMRANPKTCHVPIIFVTAVQHDAHFAFRGYESGAVDYMIKPIEPLILHAKVRVFAQLYRQSLAIVEYERYVDQMGKVIAAHRGRRGPQGDQLRLLLVDDRPENLVALEAMLGEMDDVMLVRAHSGAEALRAILLADFAAVLLDVQMPGMDGFETAELIRANPKTSTLPIIFVTAGMDERDSQFKGYERGAVDYLIKPIEPLILVSKMRVFCDLYRQRLALETQGSYLESVIAERTEALRQSAAELAASRERYRRLLGAVSQQPFSISRVEGQLQSRRHGPDCEALTGYPPSAFENDPKLWLTIIDESERGRVQSLAEKTLGTGQSCQIEHRIRCCDGVPRWVRSTFVRAEAPSECDVLIEDIDQRRRAEDERARLADNLALATRAARLGIWDWDIVHNELVWDERMYEMCGVAPGVLGSAHQTWVATVHPDDRARCEAGIDQALRGVRPYAIEFRVCWPDGSTHYLQADGLVVRDDQGKPLRMTGMHIDITERKRAEEDMRNLNEELETRVAARTQELRRAMDQIVDSEKLASLGGVVAGVAHELSTPIGNIVLTASTIADRGDALAQDVRDGQLTKGALLQAIESWKTGDGIILRNAQRACELVESFKKVAVDQTSQRRRSFDLRDTINDILNTLGTHLRRAKVSSDLRLPPGIQMDSFPGDLEQIFSNLIMNSIRHGFASRDSGHIVIDGARRGPQVEIIYSDDGVGIAPELHRKVFDPFYTTKLGQGGSGLGMFIVHNLAHGALKGTIRLDSASGQGVVITLTLPLVTP